MVTDSLAGLLAQAPQLSLFISPWKLVAVVVLFYLWALYAMWVDKDTIRVNTFRIVWNAVAMSAGIAATLCILFIPVFWIGAVSFVVIVGGAIVPYILHRNAQVREEDRVLTSAHIKKVLSEGLSGGKKKKSEPKAVRESVRLVDANKKKVAIPEEEEARELYRVSQELLFDTFLRRAQQVKFAPAGQTMKLGYVVDGVDVEREPVERPVGEAMLQYFKRLAGLSLEERRKPQKGVIVAQVGARKDHKYDLVIRSFGTTAGEQLEITVIGDEKGWKISHVGFTDKQLEQVKAFMEAPRGLVIVSAPPKQGLTSTVYAITRSHDAFLLNIQTLEYEIELPIDNITQRTFQPTPERTFAEELLKLVRTDPNVVILPQVRDKESAVTAAKAAGNKQKVYVGLPAGDLFDAIRRWVGAVGDPGLVAKSLLAVTHQRLVRKLCRACRQPYKPDPQTLRKLNMPPDTVLYRVPEPEFDKHGNPIICQACGGTGYDGRTAVYVILAVDDALREVISRGATLADLQAYAIKKGGLNLQQHALAKVLDGTTSIEEVARVTRKAEPGAARKPASGGASSQKAASA